MIIDKSIRDFPESYVTIFDEQGRKLATNILTKNQNNKQQQDTTLYHENGAKLVHQSFDGKTERWSDDGRPWSELNEMEQLTVNKQWEQRDKQLQDFFNRFVLPYNIHYPEH